MMILDSLESLNRYFSLNSGFKKAADFLSRTDLKSLSLGKHQIDGDRVFAIIVNEAGRNKADSLLEIHRRYIDIQAVLSGTDVMGWKPLSLCTRPTADFNQEIDAQLFEDEPDTWFSVRANSFAVFFPDDAHTAMISTGKIHKVIIKVAVDKQ